MIIIIITIIIGNDYVFLCLCCHEKSPTKEPSNEIIEMHLYILFQVRFLPTAIWLLAEVRDKLLSYSRWMTLTGQYLISNWGQTNIGLIL